MSTTNLVPNGKFDSLATFDSLHAKDIETELVSVGMQLATLENRKAVLEALLPVAKAKV